MAPAKKTTNKPKTTTKKPTVKKVATDNTEKVVHHEEIKKAVVKREIFDNPLTKADKKDLKSFKGKYIESVGRRKTSIARIRFYLNDNCFAINDKSLNEYFPLKNMQERLIFPLRLTDTFNKFGISVKVIGGGFNSQAEAIVLGISRCLIKFNKDFRPVLKQNGLLTRDARIVERKKYGLHKARRAPQ